jgi:hypothetical protein
VSDQTKVECPFCDGKRTVFAFVNTGEDSSKHISGIFKCSQCNGTGEISADHYTAYLQGRSLRKARIELGESLSAAAKRNGISAAELSNIESGRKPSVLRAFQPTPAPLTKEQ